MWLLIGVKDENKDQVFYISQSKEYIVSRKGGDITLANDQSISRTHTRILHGTQKEEQLMVTDMGSKYGTFLIDDSGGKTKLTQDQEVALKSGNVIQFGLQWNVFRLEYMPLVVCASTLSAVEKSQLKQIVETLNGELVSDWQEDITHLTMNKITLTVKVVCALGYGKPIVSLDFWSAVMEAVSNNRPLPNYEDYIPVLAEKALNKAKVSFKIDQDRQILFTGKTFVAHSSAQKQRIENMVAAAGGKVVIWSDSVYTKEQMRHRQFLPMKPNPSESQDVSNSYNQLIQHLKDNDMRTIAESEIGISVVYCSIEKYCNPRYDFNSNLVKSEASSNSGSYLVAETPVSARDSKTSNLLTIPESAPLLTPTNGSRRSRLIDDAGPNYNNGFKTEPNDITMRSEAAGDMSRDIFASTEDSKSSLSALTSARKRPSVFMADDDDANAFSFGKRRDLNRSTNPSSSRYEQEENGVSSYESSGNLSKKPRLSLADPDDVFNFPSDRKNSSAAKRRISIFGDEVDSGGDTKRTRLDGSNADSIHPQPVSWSQEMRSIDDKMNAVGFTSRPNAVKIEKMEDDEIEMEKEEYLNAFRNKAIVESKDLIPPQRKEPVEHRPCDDGPNFKKFKKNNICRVNVTKIIGKNNLRPFELNDQHDIWGNLIEEEEVADHFPQFETGMRRGMIH